VPHHHPKAGQSAHNSSAQKEQRNRSEKVSQKNGKKDLLKAVNDIVGLLDEDKKKAERRAIKRYAKILRDNFALKKRESNDNDNAFITRQNLKDVIETVLRNRPNPFFAAIPPIIRSWAAVIAQITSNKAAWQPRVVVPAQRAKELVVRGAGSEPSFRNRTLQQIVQAVNTATGGSDAVVARTMFSGDVIIIFRGDADFRAQNITWVTKAFGDAASIFRRELAIFAKGLPAKKLRDTHDKANLTEIFR
jgi:negative regulator of replication initiation